LEEGSQQERICALHCMGNLKNPHFARRVIPFLSETDMEVREAAIESLERLMQDQAEGAERFDEVIEIALKDSHPPPSGGAACASWASGAPKGISSTSSPPSPIPIRSSAARGSPPSKN
jgi:hypothetical protein